MQSLFRDDLLLWCQEGDCALQRDVIFTGTPEGVGAVEAARFRAESTLPRQHRPAALGAWALWLVLASKPGGDPAIIEVDGNHFAKPFGLRE
ncbi:hypothetical protein [Paraburkholderia youngii]|uniref:hypothetical protein n=1 Tax=Paraburkholderia youngii TaxID=2782701 RepID=UPI003D191763